jgi:uncharacterized SAM-binding protein YcdF (DUF218 family)
LLAFCGGPSTQSEAELMKAMAVDCLGIAPDRILTETRSRNTKENAALLAPLLPAGQGRRLGLVTSATHMRRSHAVFRGQFPHDTIVPIPVHSTYDPVGWSVESIIPSVNDLKRSAIALHEWIGLPWYALRYR